MEDKNLTSPIIELLKKATTEMLVLSVLIEHEAHIYSIVSELEQRSGGKCKIAFPYAAIYRLIEGGYIAEAGKRIDDNRRRQFYCITDNGREYYRLLKKEYLSFTDAIRDILSDKEEGI